MLSSGANPAKDKPRHRGLAAKTVELAAAQEDDVERGDQRDHGRPKDHGALNRATDLLEASRERLSAWRERLERRLEEVERELGISGSVKLASNENPLGPSPKAVAALRSGKKVYLDKPIAHDLANSKRIAQIEAEIRRYEQRLAQTRNAS